MTVSFDMLMRQADLLAIADKALARGAYDLYDKLIHDAVDWEYERIARHLTEVTMRLPDLTNDVHLFLKGIPLTPSSESNIS